MPHYEARPHRVEAEQFFPELPLSPFLREALCPDCQSLGSLVHLRHAPSFERVRNGAWIVREPNGHFSVMPPDAFETRYAPSPASAPPRPATAEDQAAWYATARQATLPTLPDFLRQLTEGYVHSYDTVCHAIAAACLATASALDSALGGLSGYQGSWVDLLFVKQWRFFGDDEHPFRILDYSKLLYPQYERDFLAIPAHLLPWLKQEAKRRLATQNAAPTVLAHWQAIAAGTVPFGLQVEVSE